MSTTGEGKGKRGSLSATQITACKLKKSFKAGTSSYHFFRSRSVFLIPVITHGGEFFGLEGLENVRPPENILKDALRGVVMGFER
jgi:hypothetical protein